MLKSFEIQLCLPQLSHFQSESGPLEGAVQHRNLNARPGQSLHSLDLNGNGAPASPASTQLIPLFFVFVILFVILAPLVLI